MPRNERHFAVVVGINKYPGISNLKYAVNDSNAFRDWLLDPKGGNLPEENIHLLSIPDEDQDDPLERATARPDRKPIIEAILAVMKQAEAAIQADPNHWQNCRFYFFGSGHGFTPHAREAALLMANSGPDMYGENIGTTKLSDLLEKRQPFSEVFVFADCCRQRVENAPVGGFPFSDTPKNNGTVKVFGASATRYGALAFESGDPDLGLSYFTLAVLEGLNGKGLKKGETHISSVHLEDFVNMRLRKLTEDKEPPQIPDISNNRADPFLITTIDPSTLDEDRFRLKFPEGFSEKVRLLDGKFNPLPEYGDHDPSSGEWLVDLKFGLYKLVRASDETDLPFDQVGIFQVTSGKGEHVFIHAN